MPLFRLWSQFQLALSFLSQIPVGSIASPLPSLGRASWAFAVVGGLIGGVVVCLYLGCLWLGMPDLAAAGIALGGGLVLTGGLHEDGLADTADGFGGGQTTKDVLRIMKDSQVGSYGVLALVIVMLVKAGILTGISWTAEMLVCAILVSAFSRICMLSVLACLPAARTGGLGQYYEGLTLSSLSPACVLWMVCSLAVSSEILFVMAIMAGLSAGMMALSRRRIGGQTGDVCGAVQLLTETAGWLSLLVLFG